MIVLVKIPDSLLEKLNKIPPLPGIYKMLDPNGNIIYIGKSISLDKRVKSYFVPNPRWNKVNRMISLIHDIDFIVMDTHLEARLLECELIKRIKPIFNSQFKNSQNYVYIKIKDYNIHNPLAIVNNKGENTFGPFRRRFNLIEMIDLLKNIYPIKKMDGNYSFEYNLLPLSMDKEVYELNKEVLKEIFPDEEKLTKLIAILEKKMKESASSYLFETASKYKELINNLSYLKNSLYRYRAMLSKDIVLKITTQNGYKLFYISKGEILHKKNYQSLEEKDIDDFIDKGRNLIPSIPKIQEEKDSIDFRDILFSEILSLPKDMVIFL